MRVISGSARRTVLKTVEGMDTRPTTDRIKETLFNMISGYLCDSSFLDLFAGSGAIGIEALSRGAREAVFVESSPKAAECIRENLKRTSLTERGYVMIQDVISALAALDGKKQFDYIFLDPPYRCDWERKVLAKIADSNLLSPDALIIVEAAKVTDLSFAEEYGYQMIKEKVYKTNKHIFLEFIKN